MNGDIVREENAGALAKSTAQMPLFIISCGLPQSIAIGPMGARGYFLAWHEQQGRPHTLKLDPALQDRPGR
jgi:hypothetical protein